MLSLKGVPVTPDAKDNNYRVLGLLADQFYLFRNKKVNCVGLPSSRAIENINKIIEDYEYPFEQVHYIGLEKEKDTYKQIKPLYDGHNNILLFNESIEDYLNKTLLEFSIYCLDFCHALTDKQQINKLVTGIERTRKPDTFIIIQVTHSPRRPKGANEVEHMLPNGLSNVILVAGPEGYMGNSTMLLTTIVLGPQDPVKFSKSIGIAALRKQFSNTNKASIKDIRVALGMTQKEFASKLDVHNITVSRWETTNYKPRLNIAKKINELASSINMELE